MDIPISLDLHRFPDRTKLIGEMLLGYSDMEFMVLDLVGRSLGGIADDAAPIIYKLRGAEDRLNVADGLLKPFMEKLGIGGKYGEWLGAMRRCKTIRNQYAHCAWDTEDGELGFANLYDAADGGGLVFNPVSLELLQEQYRYFQFTYAAMMYLMAESRFRQDRRRRHKRKMPKSLPAPKLHSAQH